MPLKFPSPVTMGKGQNGRWKMSLEAAVPILHAGSSRYWSSDVDLRLQHHLAAFRMIKQPSLGAALLAPQGERPRKGGLTKAHLSSPSWLATVNGYLLKRSQNIKTRKVHTHLKESKKILKIACWNVRTMLDATHNNWPECHSSHELTTLLLLVRSASQEKAASKSMSPDTPSPDQGNRQQRGAFQASVPWSAPPLPLSWKICQVVIPTAWCPCAFLWKISRMPCFSVYMLQHFELKQQKQVLLGALQLSPKHPCRWQGDNPWWFQC